MDEHRLPESIESELLVLLIEADRPDGEAISTAADAESSRPKSIKALVRRALEVILFIAAIPPIIILAFGMAAFWVLIFVIENQIRFFIARAKGRPFKIVWSGFGGSGGMAGTIGSLKVVIYPNDHPPPHFHVLTDMYNVKFDIETCESLGGELPGKHLKAIRGWHAKNIDLLREKWKVTRPGAANG